MVIAIAIITIITIITLLVLTIMKKPLTKPHTPTPWGTAPPRSTRVPAGIVNLSAFDANAAAFARLSSPSSKTIRVATKSIRVPDLILRVLSSSPAYDGIMAFDPQEAAFLTLDYPQANALRAAGGNDVLLAYPIDPQSQLGPIVRMVEAGVHVRVMVDSVHHVSDLARVFSAARRGDDLVLDVVVDVDMSYRPFGDILHVGVRRSPIHTLQELAVVVDAIDAHSSCLSFAGIMGYEAQHAGLPNASPFVSRITNVGIRLLQHLSHAHVSSLRAQLGVFLSSRSSSSHSNRPLMFNGGGTGSACTAARDPYLTEFTIGSGLLCSHLFDLYTHGPPPGLIPALVIALRVTRKPRDDIVVVSSGGFVASGDPRSGDKAPIIVLPDPATLAPLAAEGWGEVQTPLCGPGARLLSVGDTILVRPSKAGEIAERFSAYFVFNGDDNEPTFVQTPTYRGYGLAAY